MPGLLEQILDIARQVPSWCNAQPWHVHIVEGDTLRDLSNRLNGLAAADIGGTSDLPFPSTYDGPYRARRTEAAASLYGALGIERENIVARRTQIEENYRFFGAPHVLVVTTSRDLGVYGVLDCGAFITTVLLAAQALGIAAIAQAAPAVYSETLRAAVGVEAGRDVVAVVSLGREDHEHAANSFRVPRAEVASFATRAEPRVSERN